jgi:hypothetical protein
MHLQIGQSSVPEQFVELVACQSIGAVVALEMSDSPCGRAICAVKLIDIRGGDESTSTSARDAYHFCQRPLRLLKFLKKPLGSCDIKRPLGEPDIALVKLPWLLLLDLLHVTKMVAIKSCRDPSMLDL